MIEYNPESLELLKSRYPKSIEDTYIQLDVARGIRSRPGTHKEHVFDFIDRVRLIISKEQEPNGRLVIHISGSVRNENFNDPEILNDNLVHHIIEHWNLLSGDSNELEVKGITQGQVIHFYRRLDN